MENNKKKKIISLSITLFIVMLLVSGGTLAYWSWQTADEQKTEVTLTISQYFSCAADGGGNITAQDAFIAPTSCTNSQHAIKREIKAMPTVLGNNPTVNMQLYLDVNLLDTGLSNSQNFRYALTTSSTSCTEGVISSGNFKGKVAGNKVQILDKDYTQTLTDTYYLYIWLDGAETSQSTMNQNFSLSLSGQCQESPNKPRPEKPALDPGMIPVKIANNGTVTTVSSTDSSWYNYDNKEWANVVLVDSDSRSTYKGTTGVTVNPSDILAYYVWIPRYSYKIPEMTCDELNNPTLENNSECFKLTLTPEDKTTFINSWHNSMGWIEDDYGVEYTLEDAKEDIEIALNTGTIKIDGLYRYYLLDEVLSYNSENDPDITHLATYSISESDKELFINYWYDYEGNYLQNEYGITYTMEQATEDVETMLNTGLVYIEEEDYTYSFVEILSWYNDDNDPNITYSSTISESNKELFIEWWYNTNDWLQEDYGYTLDNAREDIETAINSTGIIRIDEIYIAYNLIDEVLSYNSENDPDINYETTFMPNNEKDGPRPIDISFESKNASVLTGDAINAYRTHPAFIFGNENISGIWVGKFEATGDGTTPTVLPNSASLTRQNVSTQFQTSLKFAGGTLSNGIVSFAGNNTYGLTANTDSHMMKNSEWGAVAYLSHSQYGINEEIRINNYDNRSTFKTGCGASEPDAAESTECQIAYGGASSYPQSTTGNISGVFDMSGGAVEYTMGVLADDSDNPRSGFSLYSNSGFNGLLYMENTSFTSGIAFPIAKYYDLYTSSNSLTACNGGICYGHALSETSWWYGDYADFVVPVDPWFIRGGYASYGVVVGAFYSYSDEGYDDAYNSWRPVFVAE